MKPSEQKRFDRLYQRHLRALILQGFSKSTIDVYLSRGVHVQAVVACGNASINSRRFRRWAKA